MNWSRFALAAGVAWVASLIIGYVVNEILLADLYAANAAQFRNEGDLNAGLPLGFAFMLVGFLAFTYAYAKGYEGGNGIVEGARFGLLIGVMLSCFVVIWNYVTMPLTGAYAVAGIVDYVVEYTIYGAIVGALYKPKAAAA
jgi:hypothetical protein